MNKNCERFIEEQKKFLNYFKNKKPTLKTKEKEYSDQSTKKTGEFSKMDISIASKNILEMNEQIKNLMNKNEINNFSHFKLSG